MTKKQEPRIYRIEDVIRFQKNNEPFGELSNMATNFPLIVNEIPIPTNEALYQACRFPDYPDYQRIIIEQKSPMAVKYVSRKYNSFTRVDWESVKVNIMRWCLRVKLALHFIKFGDVLKSTGEKPIVETSKIDTFWGAKLLPNGTLIGINALGRLLMDLRERINTESQDNLLLVEPLQIPEFRIYGQTIFPIIGKPPFPLPTDQHSDTSDSSHMEQLNLPF